jgi:hypothetical protein
MNEKSTNHNLATKLSNVGAGLFLAGMILCITLPDIGGLSLISSFFLGAIAFCLGISTKNTRAIIVGIIPVVLVVLFVLIGMYAINNGMVVE